MKLVSKTLIVALSTLALTQSLNAKTTICYKQAWNSPSTIESTELDGGLCKGEFSFNQMKEKGWSLKDLKIEKAKTGLNYIYTLTDEEIISIDNSEFMSNKHVKLDYSPFTTKLNEIINDTSKIDVPNLRVGQSGIVKHVYENGKSLVVANALVISSDSTSSTVKLVPFLDIKQNAIPTSNRKAQEGDEVIINYLYDSSLIIAPSQDAFLATREKYVDNNFLHSDLFASKLKTNAEPLPSKETIQDFAISQNIGTLFFIIKNKVYIVDSKTFAILEQEDIAYNFTQDEKMPFYTRVEKIEENPFESFLDYENWLDSISSFLGDDKRTEEEILLEDEATTQELVVDGRIYNNYYETLLGLKDDK